MTIVVSKDTEGLFRHKVTFPEGVTFYADVPKPTGEGSAPDPHAYFDAALASCKALTVTLYARQRKYPLDSIDVAVEHDGSQERQGQRQKCPPDQALLIAMQVQRHGRCSSHPRIRLPKRPAQTANEQRVKVWRNMIDHDDSRGRCRADTVEDPVVHAPQPMRRAIHQR